MNMRKVVEDLVQRGHIVKVYTRKDGGILIRQIDGVNFTGAKGNAVAREMTGIELSEKKSEQLSKITSERTTGLESLDRMVRKAQRLAKKSNAGVKIKLRQVKVNLKKYGYSETLRRVKETIAYFEGYAYSKNIEHLIARLVMLKQDPRADSSALDDLIITIRQHAPAILEEWIYPIYAILYDFDEGRIEFKDALMRIYTIIAPALQGW